MENIFNNLSAIGIHGKNIFDLSAIKDYNISSLVIGDNEALESIDGFSSLDSLSIKNTNIKDINNLINLSELTIDSKIIPAFDQIADNLRSLKISQSVQLSELNYENNIYVLPDYLQDALNQKIPQGIKAKMKDVIVNSNITYIIRDEIYANSTKTEEIELINENGIWKIDLTNFIENNDKKNKYLNISVDIMGEWGSISKYKYVINYDLNKSNTQETEETSKGSPETGDSITLWISLMAISIIGIIKTNKRSILWNR